MHVAMANLQSLYDDLHRLGDALGRTQNADALCTQIRSELAAIQTIADKAAHRPRVLFVLYRRDDTLSGVTTAAAGTTHDDLIRIAGGENIFAGLSAPYPQVSKESLLARRPEIIIEPRAALDEAARQRLIADWHKLPTLPAVQSGNIFFPDADLVLQPGPRVVAIAREFARIIHPELFHD
jgi:iron complex transport system substrate-binding protein